MYLPSRKMQKVDELKIFRSVPHVINTDCDAMQTHRLSCYILLRRSACTRTSDQATHEYIPLFSFSKLKTVTEVGYKNLQTHTPQNHGEIICF